MPETMQLTSLGFELEMDPPSFGTLRDSNDLLGKPEALRARMSEDGYLCLRGLLKRDEVLAARRCLCGKMAATGMLDPRFDLMDAVVNPGKKPGVRSEEHTSELQSHS